LLRARGSGNRIPSSTKFSPPIQTSHEPTQPPVRWTRGPFLGEKRPGRGDTTHPHLAPRSNILLLPLHLHSPFSGKFIYIYIYPTCQNQVVSFFVSDYSFVSFHVSSNRLHLETCDTCLYNIKRSQYFPVWTTTSLIPLNTEISPNCFK